MIILVGISGFCRAPSDGCDRHQEPLKGETTLLHDATGKISLLIRHILRLIDRVKVVEVESLPLLVNGKVDRQKLLALFAERLRGLPIFPFNLTTQFKHFVLWKQKRLKWPCPTLTC